MAAADSSGGWSGLKRDTAIYGLAMMIDRLSGFVLLPVLTAGMDRATFGAWNQVLTAFALLSNILELGFFHAIVRYVPGVEPDRVGRILHGMLAIIAVNCVIFLALAYLVPDLFSQVLFAQREASSIIFTAASFVVSECFFEFLVLAFLRAFDSIFLCSVYYVIKNLVRVLLLWVGLTHGTGLGGLLGMLTVSNAVLAVIVYAVHIAPRVTIGMTGLGKNFWWRTIRYSGAIVLSTNLSWANVSFNRFLIVYLLGLADLGVYSANYSIASIVNIAALVVNFTVVPQLNKTWNIGDKSGVRQLLALVTRYYCYATVPMAVAIGVFYAPLAHLLTSRDYLATPDVIWLLVTFMVLLGLEQLTTYATFLDNSHFSVRVRGVSLMINVALNLLLLKPLGISGSALAASVSAVFVVGCNHWFLRRMAGYEPPLGAVTITLAAAAAMGITGHYVLLLLPAPTFGYAVVAGFVSVLVYVGLESLQRGSISRQIIGTLGLRKWSLMRPPAG